LEVKKNSPYLCRPLPRERGKKAGSLSLKKQFFSRVNKQSKGKQKGFKKLEKKFGRVTKKPLPLQPQSKKGGLPKRAKSSNSSYE